MKQNSDYKREALAALSGNWPQAVLATLVATACGCIAYTPYMSMSVKVQLDPTSVGIGALLAFELLTVLLMWAVTIPLEVGYANSFKKLLVERDDNLVSNMFSQGFKPYLRTIWAMFLYALFVGLWSLLLFIPGIIKSFSYAMTIFIIRDNPELSANQAIERSMAMMKGHKFDLFYLFLSFIGWGFLCLFTLGIGYLWLIPYMMTSVASFYMDVKAEYEAKNGIVNA